ncbi:isoleucine--tRNA ligase ISM1 Ecym_2538 [Eremothecium cymbalariae DBVPG|uniref:isoleucine--tRNA ligase n=1 Tax=Eremothecium cymbalariae (strain CBS 270.75 / DBVPG 7215 / KCTC 17166 / NRRL Y-17582) TaxID=931890 RepID=G8JQA0_ERECY|nr:Hypothetical protein Ecym_2538 [Eremothecium cymbalariae DBVPG\
MFLFIRRYSAHSYQKTLRLPRTKFANRSDLRKVFEELIPQCSEKVYQRQYKEFLDKISTIENDEDKVSFLKACLFVLHDGPPYANGDLHLGHALNKILKDITNRHQLLEGKYVFYKPGWDCHGLPIEIKALQKLSDDVSNISATKVRSVASKYALETVKTQMEQFQKFAIMTNWDDPYITMDRTFELDQLRVLQNMFSRGLIRRQRKPVYWGTETQTALAEGELEYKVDHVSTAAYIKFSLSNESCTALRKQFPSLGTDLPINCLVWTSTPWTLFSNMAICYNKGLEYSLIKLSEEILIVESNLWKTLAWGDSEVPVVISEIKGTNLHGLRYINSLMKDGVSRPLLHGDHVTKHTGTGLVHTAPGHGHDDYLVSVAHGLEVYSPVDHKGRYKLNELPPYLREILKDSDGRPMKVLDRNTTTTILLLLKRNGMLLYSHEYKHSYPYDWRSKKPVIIRSTPQWFADLRDVRSLSLKSLDNVTFVPSRGYNRLSSFIRGRTEWCISRQRSWGVPIPVLYRIDNPDEMLVNDEIISHIIETIAEKGIDSWFMESCPENMIDWLPSKYKDVAHLYFRGKDTIDVWFDSGSSWNVISRWYKNTLGLKKLPEPLSNVYLEGSDQHRGWFQSSLLTRVAALGKESTPFGAVVTHGFTLDGDGMKMSKSLGNVILPSSIILGDKNRNLPSLGVDGLRLLVAQADFTSDIVASSTVINHVAESLKKFRLTLRFILGNLQESETFNLLPFEKLRPVDLYVLSKLQDLNKSSKDLYDNFNFCKVLTDLQYHMNNNLSAFYFDIIKDSLYCDSSTALKRQQIQTTLFHIFDVYRAILAPIIPVMVQEAWNHLPKQWLINQKTGFVDPQESSSRRPRSQLNIPNSQSLVPKFEKNQLEILNKFNELFKKMPTLTKNSQVKLTLISQESLPFDEQEISDLTQAAEVRFSSDVLTFHTEQILTIQTTLENDVKVKIYVQKSSSHKCPRCWKNNSPVEDHLCARCASVVRDGL